MYRRGVLVLTGEAPPPVSTISAEAGRTYILDAYDFDVMDGGQIQPSWATVSITGNQEQTRRVDPEARRGTTG